MILFALLSAAAGSRAGARESVPDTTGFVVATETRLTRTIPRAAADSAGPPGGADRDVHPARTRLVFTPTARPLQTGQGYVALYELFLPFVGVGVTDFLSLAGGISIIPGADRRFFMFAPVLSPIATDNFAAAGGLLYFGERGGEGVGILYADMTIGQVGRSLTLGLGWGFRGRETSDRPEIIAGFQLPFSPEIELVSESWFPPNLDPALFSLGLRFSSGPVSADLALWFTAGWNDSGVRTIVPWVSFAYGF